MSIQEPEPKKRPVETVPARTVTGSTPQEKRMEIAQERPPLVPKGYGVDTDAGQAWLAH